MRSYLSDGIILYEKWFQYNEWRRDDDKPIVRLYHKDGMVWYEQYYGDDKFAVCMYNKDGTLWYKE